MAAPTSSAESQNTLADGEPSTQGGSLALGPGRGADPCDVTLAGLGADGQFRPVVDVVNRTVQELVQNILAKLWHLPSLIRRGLLYSEAVENVRQSRFDLARAKLVRIRDRSPRRWGNPAPATMLLALVCLKMGDADMAANTAREGVGEAQRNMFLRPAERALSRLCGQTHLRVRKVECWRARIPRPPIHTR
jgi:hypothetical protein